MEMFHRDRIDEAALRCLDDIALEDGRVWMVADEDPRLDLVLRELMLRATQAIESVCRNRGSDCGLSREQVMKSIEDASVRLLLRLMRGDRQAPVTAVAAEIAASCVDAQERQTWPEPRLAARRPVLRVADEPSAEIKRAPVRNNNWRT